MVVEKIYQRDNRKDCRGGNMCKGWQGGKISEGKNGDS